MRQAAQSEIAKPTLGDVCTAFSLVILVATIVLACLLLAIRPRAGAELMLCGVLASVLGVGARTVAWAVRNAPFAKVVSITCHVIAVALLLGFGHYIGLFEAVPLS